MSLDLERDKLGALREIMSNRHRCVLKDVDPREARMAYRRAKAMEENKIPPATRIPKKTAPKGTEQGEMGPITHTTRLYPNWERWLTRERGIETGIQAAQNSIKRAVEGFGALVDIEQSGFDKITIKLANKNALK